MEGFVNMAKTSLDLLVDDFDYSMRPRVSRQESLALYRRELTRRTAVGLTSRRLVALYGSRG